MTYAVLSDVQTRLGRPLTADETTQVPILLGDVELEIESKIPDLADKITAGTVKQDVVVLVEANAVVRILRNPNGYTSETDGEYTYQINYKLNSGELNITDKEWALLGISAGIFMINPRVPTPFDCYTREPRWWYPL